MRVEKRVEAAAKEVAAQAAKEATDLNQPAASAPAAAADTNVGVGRRGVSQGVHLEMMASGEVLPTRATSFANLAAFIKRTSVPPAVRAQNVGAIKARLRGIDRVLTNSRGQLLIRDQHLDILFRWAYLAVYAIFVGLFASAPAPRPGIWPASS